MIVVCNYTWKFQKKICFFSGKLSIIIVAVMVEDKNKKFTFPFPQMLRKYATITLRNKIRQCTLDAKAIETFSCN